MSTLLTVVSTTSTFRLDMLVPNTLGGRGAGYILLSGRRKQFGERRAGRATCYSQRAGGADGGSE